MADNKNELPGEKLSSLILGQLSQLTQMASGAKGLTQPYEAMASLWGDNWVKDVFMKSMDPERLQAMADAGQFLKDSREVAGLNLAEMSEALGMKNTDLLEDVENGKKLLPFEYIFRTASLLARHDPIPFIVKFLRTYNPALEKQLDAWNLFAMPKQFERERRFLNIYRKYDVLRSLSDDEFERVIEYTEKSMAMTLEIMTKEKQAAQELIASAGQEAADEQPKPKAKPKSTAKPGKPRKKTPPKN